MNSNKPLSSTPPRQMVSLLSWCVGALIVQLAPITLAQQLPNAGVLERGAEQGFKAMPVPKLKPQEPSSLERKAPKEGEVSVTVKRFEFEGNQKLSTEQLRELLQSFMAKPLSFAQLKAVGDEIMNAYRQKGWVVRAFLPKQEIEDGVVKWVIVEGVFGGTQVDGEVPKRISPERLIKMGNAANPIGEALRAVQIDRALLLMDDLPGVMVSGNLVAGDQEGQTRLSIQATDAPVLDASLSLDNAGSISTGAARTMLNANLNSPLKAGDLLNANLLKSEGSNYARLNYTLPLGYTGLRAGVHASTLNYNLIGAFSALGGQGTAYTGGLDVNYPILRTQSANLNFTLNWDHKWYENQANQSVTSKYQMQVSNWILSGNALDDWFGGGSLSFSLGFTQGHLNMADSPNALADAQTVQTAGSYAKSNFNIARQQVLSPSLTLLFTLSAQRANKNLDSSEKIYLGGATAVRAYPSNEGGGSEGQTLSLELRQRFLERFTLAGFYDYGRVSVYHNNQDVLGGALSAQNEFALRGAGLSLSWQGLSGLDLKLSVARRVLDNPIASLKTGADSDGTLRLNRVWLNANWSF